MGAAVMVISSDVRMSVSLRLTDSCQYHSLQCLKTQPPAAGTTRWVVRRKAEVVAAVAGGLLSVDEACARYTLSLEEFTSWQRAVDRSGMPGLRVTRIKHYREQYERQQRY